MDKKNTRLLIVRIVLACLIVANLFAIFYFSSQDAMKSSSTSGEVSGVVADIVVEDYDKKTEAEKTEIKKIIDPIVRKLAHVSEFGVLGALILSLLFTWKLPLWIPYCSALFSVLVTACIDELLQKLSSGRAAQWQDVLLDFLGAVLFCSIMLLIVFTIRYCKKKGTA